MNREGIVRVVQKMKWYSSLSKLLLEETFANDERHVDLRSQMANQIHELYKTLLQYIIKSVCAYHQKPIVRFLRDGVKLDDWQSNMDNVDRTEATVQRTASDYRGQQSNSYLGLMVNMHKSETQSKIMGELYITDMAAEIQSLEKRKEDLLDESYRWILEDKRYQDFVDWRNGNSRRLLWIKGDAGTGKSMLLIGIVRQLTAHLETYFDEFALSYFFCQATDNRLNSATAILRGLIWMLLRQEKSLIRHLEKIYEDRGRSVFENHNAFYNLKQLLQSMLQDSTLKRAILVVDALDECQNNEPGLSQLLDLINETKKNDKVKWLISSRNLSEVELSVGQIEKKMRVSVELNPETMATAVKIYINHKIADLDKKYRTVYGNKSNPRVLDKLRRLGRTLDEASDELHRKSNGTFLWVALVFKQIHSCGSNKILERIRQTPEKLNDVYTEMMHRVCNSEHAKLCKRILSTATNAYCPLHLSELAELASMEEVDDEADVVTQCGILTVRENFVYFIHQSAKDYLINLPGSDRLKIFPNRLADGHRAIVLRSLEAMSTILTKDIYELKDRDFPITEVKPPSTDPLDTIRYSCIYWVDHLCEMDKNFDSVGLYHGDAIDDFLKKKFLYWLEALSLIKCLTNGVKSINKLVELLMVSYGTK